jgi:hypothetical protein
MENNEKNIIIYNTPDGKASVSLYAKDGSVWMNQNQLAELFDTSKQNIGHHISNILKEDELKEKSVVKNYFTTASDGKKYDVTFYSLEMILAIGFRVRSKRGTQFRIWANRNLREYMVKGFVMDDERMKNPDGRPDYFDELLERIRDIRASEKRFYQKVRDLFALSSDYDPTDKATQMFFAETQNKLLYAVTTKTAYNFNSWSNGKIITTGCSSPAEWQMAMAALDHPAHAAMIPRRLRGRCGTCWKVLRARKLVSGWSPANVIYFLAV